MLDSHIRPYIDPPLNRVSQTLSHYVTANQLTGIGFLFSLMCFAALAVQAYGWALLFVAASRLMDGLDGAVARQSAKHKKAQHKMTDTEINKDGGTDLGAFLDIVSDFIFYSGFVFFFAVGQPQHFGFAAFLIFSFIGSGCTFMSYAILAAKRGINHSAQGHKAFFYVAGLAEGTETILFFVLMCLFPAAFAWLAVIFATMCWVTAIGRVRLAFDTFR